MAAEGLTNPSRTSDAPEVSSTQRIALARGVPAEWLDRLLAAHCAVVPATPLEETAGDLLSMARELLEDAAVGVCIPDAQGKQLVVRRLDRRLR